MTLTGAYWRDIGTPDEYRRATEDVLAGRVHLRGTRTKGMPSGAPLGDDLQIDGDVRLGERVRIGKRVRIVGPSVIGDGVRIDDDATIEHSILWDNASIGARANVSGSIVGIDYAVAADTSLVDRIVANEPVAT
jgi:NDP-sugar pyrophosphorylase family protein